MKTQLLASTLAVALAGTQLASQTTITAPSNSYKLEQDVQLGREAAQQARRELPILRDRQVTSFVEDLGRQLVNGIPGELRHDQFRYTFDVVNVREINAFALPGGPTFVNRGMLEAARNEGEVAGVLAHEISHVALRHGTAQASKATPYQIGSIAGAILGSIIGGGWGRVVSEGTQFGLGVSFLRYGREYERQADLLGAQIMARAGFDPRDMANMFRTIERQSGSGGPEWLSDHPNPANRYEAINREAQSLRVANPVRQSARFDQARNYLRTLPRAPTTEQAARRSSQGSVGTSGSVDSRPNGRVQAPSARYTQYNEGDRFTVSVPSNWREIGNNDSVMFAPNGAYGRANGHSVFTHGVEIGMARRDARNLQQATNLLIDNLSENNPNLTHGSGYQRITVNGRRALRTTLENVSEATGSRETIQLTTAQLPAGDLMYVIGVAPQDEFADYRPVFDRVVQSIRLNEVGIQ
jgi:hypothetical protein